MKDKVMKRLVINVWAILALVMLSLMCGCSRKVYVPVESKALHSDTVWQTRLRVDSVTVTERIYESDFRYDSVAPILDSLNRVIGWDRYHFRESAKKDSKEIQRLQSLVDSLKSVKRDSVDRPVPYPVERIKEVDRPLAWWQRVLIWCGGISLLAAAAFAFLKFRRK